MTNSALWLLSAMFDFEVQIESRVAQICFPTATRVVAFTVSLVTSATTRFLIFHFLIIRGIHFIRVTIETPLETILNIRSLLFYFFILI
jgi:hypothetical protein